MAADSSTGQHLKPKLRRNLQEFDIGSQSRQSTTKRMCSTQPSPSKKNFQTDTTTRQYENVSIHVLVGNTHTSIPLTIIGNRMSYPPIPTMGPILWMIQPLSPSLSSISHVCITTVRSSVSVGSN